MSDENQHWLAKFHLKNFVSSDGRLFCLNKQTDEVSRAPPKQAASRAGYYDFVVDGQAISFEDRLEKIETAAAPVLKRIAQSRSLAGLTPTQRKAVANYMAAQSFRTEAFYKGLKSEADRDRFGAVFAQLWRSAFLVADEIERRRWALMIIEHDDVFYLGDHPVVLQRSEEPSIGGLLGFDVPGAEAFFPITPKCALYMPCVGIGNEIVFGYRNAVRLAHYKRLAALNGSLIAGMAIPTATLFHVLQSTPPLYRALTEGIPLPATPENIQNLNSRQCEYAHEFVYSNRPDFAFAKRVFRETPRYRETIGTKLGWTVPGR